MCSYTSTIVLIYQHSCAHKILRAQTESIRSFFFFPTANLQKISTKTKPVSKKNLDDAGASFDMNRYSALPGRRMRMERPRAWCQRFMSRACAHIYIIMCHRVDRESWGGAGMSLFLLFPLPITPFRLPLIAPPPFHFAKKRP